MRTIALCLLLTISGFSQVAPNKQQKSTTQTVRAITGVVDQVQGSFVISDLQTMQTIALLKGEGFSDDNFARFVGRKVRVRGRIVSDRDQPVLRVKNLSDIEQLEPTHAK
jgi:hypothetical protein